MKVTLQDFCQSFSSPRWYQRSSLFKVSNNSFVEHRWYVQKWNKISLYLWCDTSRDFVSVESIKDGFNGETEDPVSRKWADKHSISQYKERRLQKIFLFSQKDKSGRGDLQDLIIIAFLMKAVLDLWGVCFSV